MISSRKNKSTFLEGWLAGWRLTPEVIGCGQTGVRRTGYCRRTMTNQQVRSAGVKPRVAMVVPEDQSEGRWSLAGDALSQLPPGTDRGLRAPSCRLGSENQNRGGIHPSPNELHSADKPKASWWCCDVSFLREKLVQRVIKKYWVIDVFHFNVQL